MTIELWHLVLLLLAFFGACGGVVKLLLKHLDENHRQLQTRLDGLEKNHRDEAGQWQRMERDLLTLRAELPLQYVRREDYIRGQSILEAKLDGLATKIENALLRGVLKGGMGNAN